MLKFLSGPVSNRWVNFVLCPPVYVLMIFICFIMYDDDRLFKFCMSLWSFEDVFIPKILLLEIKRCYEYFIYDF